MGFFQKIADKIGELLDRFGKWLDEKLTPSSTEQQPQGTPSKSTPEAIDERFPRQEPGMQAPAHGPPSRASAAAQETPPMPDYGIHVSSQAPEYDQPSSPGVPGQIPPQMTAEASITNVPPPETGAPATAYAAVTSRGASVAASVSVAPASTASVSMPAQETQARPSIEVVEHFGRKDKETSQTQGGKFGMSAYEAALSRHEEKEAKQPSTKVEYSQTEGGKFNLKPHEVAEARAQEKDAKQLPRTDPAPQTAYEPQQEVLSPERTTPGRTFNNSGVYIAGDVSGAAISTQNASVVVGGNVRDSHISVNNGGVAVGGGVENSVIEQNGGRITPQTLSAEHKAELDNAMAELRSAFGSSPGNGQTFIGAIGAGSVGKVVIGAERSSPPVPQRPENLRPDQTFIPVNTGIVEDPNAVVGVNHGIMQGGTLLGDNTGIAEDAVVRGNNSGIVTRNGSGQETSTVMQTRSTTVISGGSISGDVIMQSGKGSIGKIEVNGSSVNIGGNVIGGDVVIGNGNVTGAAVAIGQNASASVTNRGPGGSTTAKAQTGPGGGVAIATSGTSSVNIQHIGSSSGPASAPRVPNMNSGAGKSGGRPGP